MNRGMFGATALSILVGVQPALAQAMPGGHPRDHELRHLQRRAEYRAEVLNELNDMMDDWREAWLSDEVKRIAEFYTEDAVVSPPDEAPTARGRDAVRAYLAELLPAAGRIETNWGDLAAGDQLAYAMGNFSYRLTEDGASPAGHRVEGTFVAVFRREGGHWLIRSQLFDTDD